MKKITVKNLIEFRYKNDRTRLTFVSNLKKQKISSEGDSGGDYWISCLRNVFKFEDEDLLDEKVDFLQSKIEQTEIKRIKDQFQRNIDVLMNFKEYDFQYLKPDTEITLMKQRKSDTIFDVNGLLIEAKPCHVFSFSKNGSSEIGAVWFIAKLNGLTKAELGMFADITYRYLNKYYSKDFYVNPDYCIAVDLFQGQEVNYSSIKNGEIPILIDSTIDDLKKI